MIILYMIFLLPLTLDAYHLAGYGQYCSDPSTRITTRADCQAAATSLGLDWGNGWWGPNDFPGCLYTRDYRNKVFFNYSPYPTNDPPSHPKMANYAEICNGQGNDCYEMNIDYLYNDINNGHETILSSALECQKLCQSTDGCILFSWVSLNVPNGHLVGRGGECWLKHTKANRRTEKYVISGPKYCGCEKQYGLVITGGDTGKPNGSILQIQSLSELISHLGVCGSPNIPDLPTATTGGKSVWFNDWLMFCGGGTVYNPSRWEAVDNCFKVKPGYTHWVPNTHFNMNSKRSAFSLNVIDNKVVAAGGVNPTGILNTLEQYSGGIWNMMAITLANPVYGHCGVRFSKNGNSFLMLIAGSNIYYQWWNPTNRVTLINLDTMPMHAVDVPHRILPALWAPACTRHGEYIYVTGGGIKNGNSADPTDGVYKYNIFTGVFTQSPGVLNVRRWGHTMGVTANNQLVVAGGLTGGWNGPPLASIEVSDDGGVTWKIWRTHLSVAAEFSAVASVPLELLECQGV